MTLVGRIVTLLLLATLMAPLGACHGVQRKTADTERLLAMREQVRESYHAVTGDRFRAVVEHTHAELVAFNAGERATPPTIDVLCISGGGDWGRLASAFLKAGGACPRIILSRCLSLMR